MKTNWERHNPIIEIPIEAIQSIIRSYSSNLTVQNVTLLSGGLSHTNYKVEVEANFVVVRVTKNHESLLREETLHAILPDKVLAPRFLHVTMWNGYGVGILEWKNGSLLYHHLTDSSPSNMNRMGRSIGQQLAALRELTFDTYGFLDTELTVAEEFRLTPENFISTIESFFTAGYASKWLPNNEIDQIHRFTRGNAHLFEEDESGARLVHGDFNGLNLLMNGSDVSAVLDWEFALSGSIYFDIGNMLRYQYIHMSSFESGLITGLNESGIVLSDNWKKLAKLADLVALCSLINRQVCGENRVRDIQGLIHMTLSDSWK
ncbi:aminoglycoside phosphotransferase family protein [Bacillus sp. NTK071]|uniref:phosphotransferase family protein n=1 Tax=Bacillus sp. NTK071 TaxID=2802175 RepID=UPI001A8E078B|nr:aminoglycoside phosphotransferase family protein [Bacillus sp. NTK071]MBN8207756.1 aminoglycoside phosphotransferase family protein [Bacillus sp. NTK071]